MSWFKQFSGVQGEDIADLEPDPSMEVAPVFRLARGVADVIVQSGHVGDPDRFLFNIALSGHVNPNHEPRDGWANDTVTVNVSQGSRREPA